ncbi:MAG: protein kinase [Phycisphaerae bacterium]|nr:protein kinase [Phycisphaerae bacterium]
MTGPQAGDRISEYVLDEQIGAGSFGQVWKAHHHMWNDTVVAIKIPTDSQFVRNLQKEGLTIHGLRHPNIVRAIGMDPYAEIPYLTMEFVDGPSLRELVDQHPSGMPIRAARRVACGILRALEHAHQNGVIHRDIKPANILIAGGRAKPTEEIEAEDVKVTDFGLGRAGQITTTSIMQSGSLLSEEGRSISGTLAYMAPEQRDGRETDERSDLYAVGIVLFEMLCGDRPSGSDMPSHLREGLPSWVDPVYSRLYTRRERRFPNATEVLQTIESSSVPPVVWPGPRVFPPTSGPMMGEGRSRTCSSCKAAVEVGDNFCIMCGTQVVAGPRRCPKCDAYPAAEDRFCVFCGAQLPANLG